LSSCVLDGAASMPDKGQRQIKVSAFPAFTPGLAVSYKKLNNNAFAPLVAGYDHESRSGAVYT
jgi:hypothetical protein